MTINQMWTALEVESGNKTKPLRGDYFQKLSIKKNREQIAYSEVIQLWQQEKSFCSFWIELLSSAPFSAYFWETPPVSFDSLDQPFEFVLVDSPQLAKKSAEPSDFQEYFESASPEQEVVTFFNLGGDAQLVVPCPREKWSAYTHLAKFVREAPQSQQHQLWQAVGREIQKRLNQQPLWVNTSGLGVHWLHIRLDSSPKYYTFLPYKR